MEDSGEVRQRELNKGSELFRGSEVSPEPREDSVIETVSVGEEEKKFALKREIGLWSGVSFFVGVMIGEWTAEFILSGFIYLFIYLFIF